MYSPSNVYFHLLDTHTEGSQPGTESVHFHSRDQIKLFTAIESKKKKKFLVYT